MGIYVLNNIWLKTIYQNKPDPLLVFTSLKAQKLDIVN